MNWSDIASTVGKFAPMVGTVLGGPAGLAIGSLVASALGVENTPEAVAKELAVNPEAVIKLREIESNERVKLQELVTQHAANEMNAAAQAAKSVNETMQSESASEHWPTYGWRPAIGFAVAFNVVASSVLVLAVFVPVMFGVSAALGAVAQLPMVLGALAGINGTVLPILGIASWFRGKAQADPGIQTTNKG